MNYNLSEIDSKAIFVGSYNLLQYHKSARSRDTTCYLALVLSASLRPKYMELHTSSHPPIPNILFLQTSS